MKKKTILDIFKKNTSRIKLNKENQLFDLKEIVKEITRRQENNSNLSTDNRKITQNDIFIAIRGEKYDPHEYLNQISANNILLILDERFLPNYIPLQFLFIIIKNTALFISKFADCYYKYPSLSMRVIGITGTNGKTTTSYILRNLYQILNKNVAIIGTNGIQYKNNHIDNPNTTPEPCFLHSTFFHLKKAGIDVVIMEVSSHALSKNRVKDILFDSIIFTNLTPDHLDFHRNILFYLNAKLKLFQLLGKSPKKNKSAFYWERINNEFNIYKKIIDKEYQLINYDIKTTKETKTNFYANIVSSSLQKTTIKIGYPNESNIQKTFLLDLFLIGHYNVLNLLGATSEFLTYYHTNKQKISLNLKKDITHLIAKAISSISILGRLEQISNNRNALILVDYAHTPDALENVLKTMKKLPHRQLLCVFGCGGDRDKKKREKMGKIATKYANKIWITSDNPRTENPQSIINMIVKGIKEEIAYQKKNIIANKKSDLALKINYTVEIDRRLAIDNAIKVIQKNDILIIAGKGHENYQIIGNKKYPFDDRQVAKEILMNKD